MDEQELLAEMPAGEELEREMRKVYRLYQYNIRQADSLIYELTKGARNGVPEKDLLEIAKQALEKCRFSLEEEEV